MKTDKQLINTIVVTYNGRRFGMMFPNISEQYFRKTAEQVFEVLLDTIEGKNTVKPEAIEYTGEN
jgi:hypothetical protein